MREKIRNMPRWTRMLGAMALALVASIGVRRFAQQVRDSEFRLDPDEIRHVLSNIHDRELYEAAWEELLDKARRE